MAFTMYRASESISHDMLEILEMPNAILIVFLHWISKLEEISIVRFRLYPLAQGIPYLSATSWIYAVNISCALDWAIVSR